MDALLFLLLFSLTVAAGDQGSGIDPDGLLLADGVLIGDGVLIADGGGAMDPNGQSAAGDDGAGLDPHGRRRVGGLAGVIIDPNGGRVTGQGSGDEGNGLDPHGGRVKAQYTACIDPNG